MGKWIVFGVLSAVLALISRRSLLKTGSHGFYRFWAWECILGLLVVNIRFWFIHPLAFHQLVSWILLVWSLVLLAAGLPVFLQARRKQQPRQDDQLFSFEKTSELIESGIYHYIRHPMYASLLFLAWGIYFKNPEPALLGAVLPASLLMYLTARKDEQECLSYFGARYSAYMKRTRMFVPFLF